MSSSNEAAVVAAVEAAEEFEETLEEAVQRLAALPLLEYDRQRQNEARRLGVRVSTLDAEVAAVRPHADEEPDVEASDELLLSEAEPWREPVDGAALLDELAATVRRYLVLPPGAPETVALWVLHAHLHTTAAISPILAITSPSPECGKTTLLDLLGALVPRPLPASNITAAALFRAVEKWQPTMLVDEADTFIRNSEELRGVLNSGHRRSAASVVRTVGEDHEPRPFRTWAPKAIALIGRLPATLASRSIEIELRRKTAREQVDPLRGDRLHHLEPLRQRCTRFATDVADLVRGADPEMPGVLRGRTADNWRHLVAIADAAGGRWPARVREVATLFTGGKSEQTFGIMLLDDLRALFAERRAERLSSAEIVRHLGQLEDRPWAEWKGGNPITVRQLARLAEPFKIAPTKFREAGYTPGTRGYERAAFEDAFSRYLPDPPFPSATAPQANESATSGAFDPPRAKPGVADGEPPKARNSAGCGAVAVHSPEAMDEDDLQVLFDERAGIMEFDGGLCRAEAEEEARREMEVLRRLVTETFRG